MKKKHWAEYLDIGRAIKFRIQDIQATIDRERQKEAELVRLRKELQNMEMELIETINSEFSQAEITEAMELYKKQFI